MEPYEVASVYLQVLVTILIFGIGFPAFLYERPTWLRRIRDKYSIWGNLHKTLVVAIFIIAVIIATYLYPGTITDTENCSSAEVQFKFSIQYIAYAIVGVIIPWLFYVFIEQSREKKGVRLARRIVKTFLAVASVTLIGMIWVSLGKPFHWFSSHAFCQSKNVLDILSILLMVSLAASAVLWYRLYLFRFDTVLGRLVEITECRYGKRRFCWNYWLLSIRNLCPDDDTQSGDTQPDNTQSNKHEKESRHSAPTSDDLRSTHFAKRWLSKIVKMSDEQCPKDSIKDMGILGANAESQGDQIAVISHLRDFSDSIQVMDTDTINDITDALGTTLSGVEEGYAEIFRRSMKVLEILSEKITEKGTAEKKKSLISKIFAKIQGILKRLESIFCRLLGVPQNEDSTASHLPTVHDGGSRPGDVPQNEDSTTSHQQQRFPQKKSWKIIKRSVSDIVTFGIETHSLEVKSLLIEEVAQIVGKSNNTDDLEFTITEIKRIAFSSPNESSNPLFTLAIETIVRLIERIDENKNQGKSVGETTTESPWLHNKLLLGRAYKILGSEALLRVNDWQAQSLQKYLLASIAHIPEGLQSETLFEFGLAAHKGDHSDEALRFLDTLHQSELPEHETYWLGLLARLAAGKETGRRWAAATAMVQSSGDDALTMLEDAQRTFILLTDFETADAIMALKPYVGAWPPL